MKTTLTIAAVTALMLLAAAACSKKDEAKAGETRTTSAALATATATATAPGAPAASAASASAPGARASCNMLVLLGTCNEYRNGSSFGLEKSLCESFKGQFANTGCATEGQIGSCQLSDGEVKRYYGSTVAGDHALTLEEAKGDCESDLVKGTFRSGSK